MVIFPAYTGSTDYVLGRLITIDTKLFAADDTKQSLRTSDRGMGL